MAGNTQSQFRGLKSLKDCVQDFETLLNEVQNVLNQEVGLSDRQQDIRRWTRVQDLEPKLKKFIDQLNGKIKKEVSARLDCFQPSVCK